MEKHYIVGTAGHIDHGKTALSVAITGKNTDRLKEERMRNISIELGFAPFTLPNGDQVSLIDVPGHEKFVRHMVAGIGGIDLVLLIIAADEGVMPQTEEHLQILELLGIEHGIVVITKKDLVEKEFLELVEEDIKELLKDKKLKNVPFISVSSKTNEGIDELKQLIQQELAKLPERTSTGFFRMPIDRVFTIKGIGTVVTGTVYSGKLDEGQELSIMPSNISVRARNLQVHSNSVKTAYAGQRVAINLSGVDVKEINRGDAVVTPNQWKPSQRIDVELDLLKDGDFSIKQNGQIKFYIGAKESVGELILFDRKEALPGEKLYCQIRLKEPIIASRKEKFIIRRPSPAVTIGGGTVIDPNAQKHKYNKETIKQLENKSKGSLEDLILEILENNQRHFFTMKDIADSLILPTTEILDAIHQLHNEQKIILLKGEVEAFASRNVIEPVEKNILIHLKEYHQKYPLRIGQPKAEFINKFIPKIKGKLSQVILDYWQDNELIQMQDEFVSTFGFQTEPSQAMEEKISKIETILIKQKFTPDSWQDVIDATKLSHDEANEIYNYLINKEIIIKLTDKFVLHQQTFNEVKTLVTSFLTEHEQITLQDAKDLLQVSRKYLVPLMELLDKKNITVLRQGHNYRILRSST